VERILRLHLYDVNCFLLSAGSSIDVRVAHDKLRYRVTVRRPISTGKAGGMLGGASSCRAGNNDRETANI
jgi:hypothetical protein